jgi:alpha-beta hydrolase superfamily lysophospholipase
LLDTESDPGLTDRNQSPFETGTDSKDDPMASAGPTSNSFISQRLKLHYVDWGNRGAPPLLLVHGGRDHCRNWDWVAEKLRDRYHIIAPDLRGHGDSAWSPDGNYAMDTFVYDLAQLVHQLDLGPLSIVAHSMGAISRCAIRAFTPRMSASSSRSRGSAPLRR